MLVSVNLDMAFVLQSLLIVVCAFLFSRTKRGLPRISLRSKTGASEVEPRRGRIVKASDDEENAERPAARGTDREDTSSKEMQLHKELYFKLQNLEQYPEVLQQQRSLLVSLFSETLAKAHKRPISGILSVEHYTRENLETFLRGEKDRTADRWQQYLARRKAGSPKELFKDREAARLWLKQLAPVKYVDGAWLGHINKITTPFALRRVTKDAWQVLSEELGDGDLSKNHVHLYCELMKEIKADLPDGDHPDFLNPRHELDEPHIWKAAVAQLLISLFPHQFLPEILGFNMHFEQITQETLKAAKELKEVKLNAYYFLVHISIDNADSGHTAIAMQTVVDYIEHTRKTQGDAAAQQAWKRVQTGFILSEGLATEPERPSPEKPAIDRFPRNELEAKVIRIFRGKVSAAHNIHCSSATRIGRRRLVDWLEPDAFASKQWQMEFLDDLSNQRPWIYRGDSNKSRLIRELSWRGKMFGSFTQAELEVVKGWIDSLADPNPQLYWSFIGKPEITQDQVFGEQDICVDYPVFLPATVNDNSISPIKFPTFPPSNLDFTVKLPATLNMTKLLPLWFTHPCLLESFVCVPFKTTTKTASAVVRFLRAQIGFDMEGPGVAGMDEVRRTESIGIVELGLEMTRRSGLSEPTCLKDVLSSWPSDFALQMLHWSMRPMANAGLLLGLAWAFVDLHDSMVSSPLLSATSREVLRQMVCRERDSLTVCLEELKDDEARYADFCKGYSLGRSEIESSCG